MTSLSSPPRGPEDLARDGSEPPVANPGLGPLGWLRWAWRRLTSMRTALWLLALVAVAAVPGSLLPQRNTDPGSVLAYQRDNPSIAPLLERLWLFDVYRSPWFSAVYLLLLISLTGCVLPRAWHHARAMRAQPGPLPSRTPEAETWATDSDLETVRKQASAVLRRRRYRVAVHNDVSGHGDIVSAEKGYLRETGNLVFHLALLLLLFAVAYGSRYGYRANVAVPEGEGFANSVVQFDIWEPGTGVEPQDLTPFSLTLNRLDVRFEEGGTALGSPREFTAHVEVRDTPGSAPRNVAIAPNTPLVVDGTKVFLLGQGYAPRFTVRDGEGRVVYAGPVTLLPDVSAANMTSSGVIKVPDANPEPLGLQVTFLPTAVRRVLPDGSASVPVSVFPDARVPRAYLTGVWRGDLGLDGGRPQSVFRLDTTAMEQVTQDGRPLTTELAPGDTIDLPDGLGSVTFEGPARFAAFSVASDPGRGWALAAALLSLAGLTASLYLRRRRVWVRAVPDGHGRTVVTVAADVGADRIRTDARNSEISAVAAELREAGTR